MVRYTEIERCVFVKCNDCKTAFWKKPLPAPRDHYVQHKCLLKKMSTRRFGFTSKTCITKHPGVSCVEKITESEYIAFDPNCGKYARYLADIQSSGQKRPSPISKKAKPRNRKKAKKSRTKKEKPRVMTEAVKNILVQNEMIHNWKKEKLHERTIAKSVWDPVNSEDGSSDTFKAPSQPTIPRRLCIKDICNGDGFFQSQESYASNSESLGTTSPSVKRKLVFSPSLKRRNAPHTKRRKYSSLAVCLPRPDRKISLVAPPSPIASDTESESESASEPIIVSIDELIAHGVSDSEDYK